MCYLINLNMDAADVILKISLKIEKNFLHVNVIYLKRYSIKMSLVYGRIQEKTKSPGKNQEVKYLSGVKNQI